MNKDVIIALDFDTKEEVVAFLDLFDTPIYVKVGMELYYSLGNEIIKEINYFF